MGPQDLMGYLGDMSTSFKYRERARLWLKRSADLPAEKTAPMVYPTPAATVRVDEDQQPLADTAFDSEIDAAWVETVTEYR